MTVAEFLPYLACDCAGGEPLVIEYRKRYPILRRRLENGELKEIGWTRSTPKDQRLCRGCGGPIGKGRSAWCCRACYDRFEPGRVKDQVIDRDKGFCQLCGHDHEAERKAWLKRRREETDWLDHGNGRQSAYLWKRENPKPRKPEYDHTVPMVFGGLTVVENIRTLCRKCHLACTAELAAKRAEMRRGGEQLRLTL